MRKTFIRFEVDLDHPPPLTQQDEERLAALALKNDSEIDFSDIPPLTEEFFNNAVPFRTLLERHRAARIQVEPDIHAWLKTQTGDPQSQVNDVLRQHMLTVLKKTA